METNKTVIITPNDSSDTSRADSSKKSKDLGLPTYSSKTKTFVETNAVTQAKIQFLKKDLERILPIQNAYNIQDKFAEGGQGIISYGKDKILQRYVAIKSLKSDFFDNDQVIENFITEAKITAQLDHPSIIPLYSIHSSAIDKGLHISMKLVHGHTLKELNADSVLLCKQYRKTKIKEIAQEALIERLEDFLKVCDAISFAHNKNVIHRDLKPENIMIGEFHEVYVMDWGIAIPYEKREDDEYKQKFKTISGTPGYIAPELVVGGVPTPKSDQYSLGMILFELMTLKQGINGTTVEEIFYKTRDGQVETKEHRFPGCKVSKDLIAITKKSTELSPEDRYSSVEELADDVRHFMLNEEIKARPDNLLQKCFRWISKHKNIAATVLLLILLCLSGVTIYALIKQNDAEKKSKIRALKLVDLHSSIENSAHTIDRHFFHIAHILSRFADNTMTALKDDKTLKERNYYPTSQFSKENQLPPGTAYSVAYKRNINLYAFNYSLAPGLKFAETKLQIEKIATLCPELLRYLINSDPDAMARDKISEGAQRAFIQEFPIRWMYIALSNGLMMNYPGSSGSQVNYDPRIRPWYIKAKKHKYQHWSKPYIDAFGLGAIISVSKSLYDKKGVFLGIASLDMTFDYITKTLMNSKAHHNSVIARYLIDENGNIILSSNLGSTQIKKAKETDSEIQFQPFPFPEIKTYIKKNRSGQFETINAEGITLIGYAPVKTLGWYYVETINLKQYLKK